MQEEDIRTLIEQVREGKLPRRGFIARMVGVGLTAPMASMLLMHHGIAQAQSALPYKPTRRGGGGTLKLLWWQGPVHLNPHWATGTKEQEGSRVFYEPLAGWDAEGNLVPVLASEIPTRDNGGLAEVVAESGGGVLYRTDNELRAAVDRLVADPELRSELGRRGHAAVRGPWSADAHMARYLEIVRECIEARAGRARV